MSMVIVEVLREYEHFDRILGEHRWDEFLRQPKADEKGRSSKVYFSTYSNYIDLKKDGYYPPLYPRRRVEKLTFFHNL